MDRDEYAAAQVIDLLLQAEACLRRARAAAYWMRGTPQDHDRRHRALAELEAVVAQCRGDEFNA